MTVSRVLIADDHQLFLDGLRMVLDTSPKFEIVGEANNGKQVLDLLANVQADLAVLDISMPEMDGIETAKAIKSTYPDMRILILSMYRQDALIKRLMRSGIDGYVLKENGQKELIKALEVIVSGQKYFAEEVTKVIIDSFNPSVKKSQKNDVNLTKRELEVLQLVSKEMTTQEIAQKIFVSQNTVITHRKNIMRKLDVRNAAGMIRLATEMGLLD